MDVVERVEEALRHERARVQEKINEFNDRSFGPDQEWARKAAVRKLSQLRPYIEVFDFALALIAKAREEP